MEISGGEGESLIVIILIWVLRELIPAIRKNKDGYSIDDKINYLFIREKKKETIEEYNLKHNKGD